MNVVILAAGEFPTHPVPLRTLSEADFVVVCDSAYNQWVDKLIGTRNNVSTYQRINVSTYQPINVSTYQRIK